MEEKQAVLAREGLLGSWKHCIEAHSAIPCLHTEGTSPGSPQKGLLGKSPSQEVPQSWALQEESTGLQELGEWEGNGKAMTALEQVSDTIRCESER